MPEYLEELVVAVSPAAYLEQIVLLASPPAPANAVYVLVGGVWVASGGLGGSTHTQSGGGWS